MSPTSISQLQWLLSLFSLASAQNTFDPGQVIAIDITLRGSTIKCSNTGSCEVQCLTVGACQNAIIECARDWGCLVSCYAESSCLGATINGPRFYGSDLDVECIGKGSCREVTISTVLPIGGTVVTTTCYGEDSCRNAVIHAPKSEELVVKGCASNDSCIGMNITCPPNYNGQPKCTLFFDNEFGGTEDEPLTIYAENGFLDLNMTESNSSLRYGTVYCTDDYSASCSINQVTANQGGDEWICDANGLSTCNTGTIGFFVELQWKNAHCTTAFNLGFFSSVTACAHYAMEEEPFCTGNQIVWSQESDVWGCLCCRNMTTYDTQYYPEWQRDIYQYGVGATNSSRNIITASDPPEMGFITTDAPKTRLTDASSWSDNLLSTEMMYNSDSNSEDEVVFDMDEYDHPTSNTEIGQTGDNIQDALLWDTEFTVYAVIAVIGICFVLCALGFAVALNEHSNRKSSQPAEPEGDVNLDNHPSLNPDSSYFVPGKAHPGSPALERVPTPCAQLEGVPTGDDV